MLKKWTHSRKAILIMMVVMSVVNINLNFGKDHWRDILEADAKGYYAYLPAAFIYHDLNFGFFDHIEKEKYYDKNLYYEYRIGSPSGKIIDKYYCGTAIAESPFFFAAHVIALGLGQDADGYSRTYLLAISIAALVYLFIGLIFFDATMLSYGFSDKVRAFTLFITLFGTNLFYYTIGHPGLSHIYSFAFVCLFVYLSKRLFVDNETRRLPLIAFVYGMIVLIRPVNGLIVLAWPFLAGDSSRFYSAARSIRDKWKHLLCAALVLLATVSLQFIYYRTAAGEWLVYSYGKEGFEFGNPHFVDILFSYKKGLFLYTPVYLLSLVGLLYIWKNSKYEATAMSLFLLCITYVLSSWWNWYYGGSFSSRVFVEYLPFFMLVFANALAGIKKRYYRTLFVSFSLLLTALCQLQTYQYRYFVIHWSDMDKDRYWESVRSLGKIFFH